MNQPIQKTKKSFSSTLLMIFMLLAICGLSYMSITTWHFLSTPLDKNASPMAIEIPMGTSLIGIANILAEEGVIKDAKKFSIYVRLKGAGQKIQAGTFLLSPTWSPTRILDELMYGKSLLYRLTIREGLPWWTVAELLEKEGFCKAKDFEKVIHDPKFLKHHGIPFQNAEGFLYPDTYFLQKPKEMDEDAARKIANRLVNTFWDKSDSTFRKFTPDGSRPDKKTLEEILTLASIIERETRLDDERPRIAGVYRNRMTINMRLQADPTVIYGLGEEYEGSLYKKHLQNRKNPYNTYKHYGLPPGPICSPSLSSIRAALNPESHDYYYFVALGIGASHVFSNNLKEHNRAVSQYRRNLKMNK